MKSFVIAFAIFSSTLIAHAQTVFVNNFSFSYKNPHGSGSATSFSRSPLVKEKVDVNVDRIGTSFKFIVTGSENHQFEFKDAPSFLTDADTILLSAFNLNLSDKLSMSLNSSRFESTTNSLKLDGLSLECQRVKTHKEIMDQLLHGCTKKLVLKSNRFTSQDVTLLNDIFSSFDVYTDKSSLGINSLDFKINEGKFELSGEVKAQVSGRVSAKGTMAYDDKSGKITLNISEVRFGILNVTNKVFEELKKNENDKLKVKQPFIYYTLK